MTDELQGDGAQRLLRLIAELLQSYLEGDELAFETLGEMLEQGRYEPDDLHHAILVLSSLSGAGAAGGVAAIEGVPGKRAQRVPSAEERHSLSPEAWGYLLDLRRREALTHGQFERVLDLLTGSGVRPVGVELAREVAARVALEREDGPEGGDNRHGDFDLAN